MPKAVCARQALPNFLTFSVQALLEQMYDRLAKRFFRVSPPLLAKLVNEMGTEAAVQLLTRDDLCCPLECYLVEVGVWDVCCPMGL